MNYIFFKIQGLFLIYKLLLHVCIVVIVFLFTLNVTFAISDSTIKASDDFEFIPLQWLTMTDDVKLSVNYWKPKTKYPGEKFPIVLEVLPYRKDDIHFIPDYLTGSYFACHGIVFARVDIRGTGSSPSVTPDREYSDQELKDILTIINQLAAQPWSNGNIGMQGISWSAFNAIMTAMQRPPYLKGILIAHGSDDIYANDIHNIDGALHLDIFTIEIEIDNILPQSPHYQINAQYFTDRFEQKPWIFTYLHHQRDSEFWQGKRSLHSDFSAVNIPVYAYAGLLDGYRDFAIHMLQYGQNPMRVAFGPQIHDWPNGDPGPPYEWRQMAVRFWQQVLNGKENGFWQLPKLLVFMRESVPTDVNLTHTPGAYWSEQWPVKDGSMMHLLPQSDGSLATQTGKQTVHLLPYKASVGKAVLNWWGETTPDMRSADEGTLVYDSAVLDKEIYLLGNPEVKLKIASSAPFAHWITRLEDVNPDGSVSLVTGGLKNSAQRESRTHPKRVPSGQFITIKFPMHFTTWKFAKGHRIRLIVTNAQFPMVWPTPYPMTNKLMVGDGATEVILPVVPLNKKAKLSLPPLEPDNPVPNASLLERKPLTPFVISRDKKGNTTARAKESYKMSVQGNILTTHYKVFYQVNDSTPSNAIFIGEGEDSIHVVKEKRLVKVWSSIHIRSDKKYFHTTAIRKVFENGKLLRTRSWKESILRDFE